MPQVETFGRLQAALLWEATGGYDNYGQPIVGAPEEVVVRWVNKQQEVIGPNGMPIALDATVVTKMDIPVGSRMWLGNLEDWYGVGSSGGDINLMVVKFCNRTPDLKNRSRRRTVGLMRFRNQEES